MDLKERLQADLIHAMKTHDDTKKWVVKMIKAAIQLAEVAKGNELDQEEILAIIQKESKPVRKPGLTPRRHIAKTWWLKLTRKLLA